MNAVLITHTHPDNSSDGVKTAIAAAKAGGIELVGLADELDKHGAAAKGLTSVDELPKDPDVCIVLGGDGSILHALREYAGTGVPVFGINFGTIGFLAATEREELDEGLRRAFTGDFDRMSMPALELGLPTGKPLAFNDVSFARRPHGRVAELSYSVSGQEVGNVRCDGLVAATPAGSTGYNLANAGPILAWGVEGFVVSFIAPHTLTARALVVAPADVLSVENGADGESSPEPVEVAIDGRHVADLAPGEGVEVRFSDEKGTLAQLPGSSFYTRIREKFGRLAR